MLLSKENLIDIGETPVVDLSFSLSEHARKNGMKVFAKVEYNNPGLSHKDRIARSFVLEAMKGGHLPVITDAMPEVERKIAAMSRPIVLASSGNTGNSVAWVGRAYGYNVTVITNSKCSAEKCADIKSKGAELKISDEMKILGEQFLKSLDARLAGRFDPSTLSRDAVNEHARWLLGTKAAEWSAADVSDAQACIVTIDLVSDDAHYGFPGTKVGTATKDYMEIEIIMASLVSDTSGEQLYFSIDQYGNQSNFNSHDSSLGPEIWAYDCNASREAAEQDGRRTSHVTDFVMVSSTGGTVTGVAHSLRRLAQFENMKAGDEGNSYPLTILADPKGSNMRFVVDPGTDQASADDESAWGVLGGGGAIRVEGAGKSASTPLFERNKSFVYRGSNNEESDEINHVGEVETLVKRGAATVIPDEDAIAMMHKLKLLHNMPSGSSAGTNVVAAIKHAEDLAANGIKNRNVFTILCDPFHKYASKFADDAALEEMGLPLYSKSQEQFPTTIPTTVRSFDGSKVLSVDGWDIEERRAAASSGGRESTMQASLEKMKLDFTQKMPGASPPVFPVESPNSVADSRSLL
jgi:cysteine synthase